MASHKHKRRMLVSDFDGTIFKPDAPEVTANNFQAIQRWREAGNLFAVATMRCLTSLKQEFPTLDQDADYLILDGGAVIYRGTDYKIMETWLYEEDVDYIEDIAKSYDWEDHNVSLVYYRNGDEFPELTTKQGISKLRIWFKDREECTDFSRDLGEVIEESHFIFYQYLDIEHIHDSYLPWVFQDYHHCLEILPSKADKGSGVTRLIKDLIDLRTAGLTEYRDLPGVITIGDSDSDISMLERAVSFTLDSASEGAKRAADYIVPEFSDLISRFLEADSY